MGSFFEHGFCQGHVEPVFKWIYAGIVSVEFKDKGDRLLFYQGRNKAAVGDILCLQEIQILSSRESD